MNVKSGRLTVVALHPYKKSGRTVWACECECGGSVLVITSSITAKRTKSCGCLNKEAMSRQANDLSLPGSQSSFNSLVGIYKRGASKRNYSFELTNAQVADKTKQNCAYCGTAPSQAHKTGTAKEAYIYNGLDRVNNSKGYENDNVVACCGTCNLMKRALGVEEFISHCKRIADRNKIRETNDGRGSNTNFNTSTVSRLRRK